MNKTLALIAAAALALPLAVNAQTVAPSKPAAKAAAKPAAKSTTTTAKKRKVTPRAAKAVEEVTPIDTSTDIALNEADLASSGVCGQVSAAAIMASRSSSHWASTMSHSVPCASSAASVFTVTD